MTSTTPAQLEQELETATTPSQCLRIETEASRRAAILEDRCLDLDRAERYRRMADRAAVRGLEVRSERIAR